MWSKDCCYWEDGNIVRRGTKKSLRVRKRSLSRLGHVRLDEIRQVRALGKEHKKTSAQKEGKGQLLQEKFPN